MSKLTKARLLLSAALLCSVLIYARTLHFDFVYDDGNQIVRNPHLESAAFIPTYFGADVWSQYHNAGQGHYYRPIFLLWLLVNRTLFGISPTGWHATSLLLQLGAVFLLYVVGTKLLKDPLGGGIAALLFAVHPANIESVAWASCSSELLMGGFLLLAFLLYLRFRAGGNKIALAVSLLLFGLALGSKETAAAFPLILMWYEWCGPREANEVEQGASASKIWTTPIVRLAPYVFVALLYFAIRTVILGGHALGQDHDVTLAVAILTVPSAMVFYLRNLLVPTGLSVFYDLPYTRAILSVEFARSVLIVVSAAGLLWALSSRLPKGRNAIGWIILPLLPPLAGLRVFTHGDLVHDRYLYLSTMGLAMLVAAFVTTESKQGWEQRAAKIALFAVTGVFVWLSVSQIGYWKNNLTLYQRGTQVSPHSVLAFDNLANERFRRNDFAGAVNTYKQSLAADPNSWTTNMALGITLTAMHEDAEAIQCYSRAITLDPHDVDQYLMLAQAQERQKLYADAEQTVIHGLAVANNMAQLHFELGTLLERRGDLAGARAQYERVLELDPAQQAAASRVSALAQVKPAS